MAQEGLYNLPRYSASVKNKARIKSLTPILWKKSFAALQCYGTSCSKFRSLGQRTKNASYYLPKVLNIQFLDSS